MNQPEPFDYTPQFGRIVDAIRKGMTPEGIRVSYNEPADELVIFLLSNEEPTVALDTTEDTYLLLDARTEDVVGFQFDNFMTSVVIERPQLLALASLAGVRAALIQQARERIGEERVRQAAVEAALRELLGDVPVGR